MGRIKELAIEIEEMYEAGKTVKDISERFNWIPEDVLLELIDLRD